tara:strand:+ start:669 stop:935 length:267 start_codon:yes stop_codon:yes gene_type:complete
MFEDSELVDLSVGHDVMTGSNSSILLYYNKMIGKAITSIGKKTTNGILINTRFIDRLKERRDEIFDKETFRKIEKQNKKDRELELNVS